MQSKWREREKHNESVRKWKRKMWHFSFLELHIKKINWWSSHEVFEWYNYRELEYLERRRSLKNWTFPNNDKEKYYDYYFNFPKAFLASTNCWVHVTPLDSITHIYQNSFMSLFQKSSNLAFSFVEKWPRLVRSLTSLN